jgi:Arc/MetJ family transcription regulator
MVTNLALDDKLVEEAKRLGKHRSKRDAVNEAILEYVARRKPRGIVRLFATMDWNPEYDYKAERRRRG